LPYIPLLLKQSGKYYQACFGL